MAKKPNIVLVECDSMDGRVMSCIKHLAAYTPNLDQMAEHGVLFRNAYCNTPQCCPSRASRWSGKHTHEIQAWNNYKGLLDDDGTYLDRLEGAGYHTKVIGKTDYRSGAHSLGARVFAWTRSAGIRLAQKTKPTQGLRRQSGDIERVHRSDWDRVDQSLKWLKQNAGSDEPFFLNCSLSAPHPSFVSSDLWLEKIDLDRVSLPREDSDLHPVMEYMSATKNCLHDFREEEILNVRRTYYAMVAEVDAMFGHLRRALSDLGLDDSTYLIFLSDHGEMNMAHRQYLKNALYDASARVPFLIAGPGVDPGREVDHLVSLVDLYPTLMDLADLSAPEGLSGHSLARHLSGRRARHPDWVLSQYHSNFANTGIFMYRRGPWKYIAYPGYRPQLFNVEKDPEEMKDLAATETRRVRTLDAALRKVVDYNGVDEMAKAYDKESFLKWQDELGEQACRTALRGLFADPWTDRETEQLEAWLKG